MPKAEELETLRSIWRKFFVRERLLDGDGRLQVIDILVEFFRSPAGQALTGPDAYSNETTVNFDIAQLARELPFAEFESTLRTRPTETMSLIGLSLSLIANNENPFNEEKIVVTAQFYNYSQDTAFSELKSHTVGELVSIVGHVIRVSPIRPLVVTAAFYCPRCESQTWSVFEDGVFTPPEECSTSRCNNKYLELQRPDTQTIDYQVIKLQELDENVASGQDSSRVPRTFDVEARGASLVNLCIPGDIVRVVGVVKTFQVSAPRISKGAGAVGGTGGSLVESGLHSLYILMNSMVHVKRSGDSLAGAADTTSTPSPAPASTSTPSADIPGVINGSDNSDNNRAKLVQKPTHHHQQHGHQISFTSTELEWIRSLALSGSCFARFVDRLCPLIFGHELVKAGLVLALFGGSATPAGLSGTDDLPASSSSSSSESRDAAADDAESTAFSGVMGRASKVSHSFKIRPDIHVLVVGDPGLGKSQLLRAACNLAPRAVFVGGNTATTAGLTATVVREGGDSSIEAGALVLADQGVCCIDELDKISCDHHALLEAMEQQSISIAKSGMVTSLKSRAAVLAAANPVGGHYKQNKSVCENLKMNAALLSRFDLVFLLLDKPDEVQDQLISEHIMQSMGAGGGTYRHDRTSSNSNSTRIATEGMMHTGDDSIAQSFPGETLSQKLRRQVRTLSAYRAQSSSNKGTASSRKTTSISENNNTKNSNTLQLSRADEEEEEEEEEDDQNFIDTILGCKRPLPSTLDGSNGRRSTVRTVNEETTAGPFGDTTSTAAVNINMVSSEILRRYIEYARAYVHPRLSKGAARVLQTRYLSMRASDDSGSEHRKGETLPVTTRHLESLIRLTQARARIDLREEATAEDATEVVELLQESMLDAFTDGFGSLADKCGRKGSNSVAKQIKALVKVLTIESKAKESTIFSKSEIIDYCARLNICSGGNPREVDSLIDLMRTECYLLLKGPKLYQLQTV